MLVRKMKVGEGDFVEGCGEPPFQYRLTALEKGCILPEPVLQDRLGAAQSAQKKGAWERALQPAGSAIKRATRSHGRNGSAAPRTDPDVPVKASGSYLECGRPAEPLPRPRVTDLHGARAIPSSVATVPSCGRVGTGGARLAATAVAADSRAASAYSPEPQNSSASRSGPGSTISRQ